MTVEGLSKSSVTHYKNKIIRKNDILHQLSGMFRCSFCKAKQSFYRSFNAVFGKIGRIATADVIIQLPKMKYLPAMLYGVEVCALKKSQTESLQFAVKSSSMKIFNTKSMNVVSECLDMFNVLSVADYIVKRKCKLLTGYINSQNSLCNLLCRTAKKDLSDMTLR